MPVGVGIAIDVPLQRLRNRPRSRSGIVEIEVQIGGTSVTHLAEGYLIGRVLLDFAADVHEQFDPRLDLSAVAIDPNGRLWLASDEMSGVSRLEPCARGEFAGHEHIPLDKALALPEKKEEIDIEGMDYADGSLWLVGSHTSTRKKVKGSKSERDNLERLARVSRRLNRFVVARLSNAGDEPMAARLPIGKAGNALTDALLDDPHLGPFVSMSHALPLASKENGFDVEGLAVRKDRLLIGLRGPVLRGWSLLLEIRVEDDEEGGLRLIPIGKDDAVYRKHFVDLSGMGVRDLVWHGKDLLVLSGPTMDISGRQTLYRLEDAANLDADSITARENDRLQPLFDLPVGWNDDKAEGLALFDGLGEPGLLVVYDAPREERLLGDYAVFADAFRLSAKG